MAKNRLVNVAKLNLNKKGRFAMSEKALTREELEVTQRMQMHFPSGMIPEAKLAKWKGVRKEVLETEMFRMMAYQAFQHPLITVPLSFKEKLTASEMLERGAYKRIESVFKDQPWLLQFGGYTSCMAIVLPVLREWESVEVAIRDVRKAGFREATVFELLALGYQYPQLQMNQPIVCLGTSIENKWPILGEMLNQRTLDTIDLFPGCGLRGGILAIA